MQDIARRVQVGIWSVYRMKARFSFITMCFNSVFDSCTFIIACIPM